MKERQLKLSEIGLIAATRGMLGAGVGLLLADKLNTEKRHAIGLTLVIVGVLTTIPLALSVFGQDKARSTNAALQAQATEPAFVEC